MTHDLTKVLRIQLLGEFKVYRAGVAVEAGEWHTRQARQLLKILLTEPNRVISSERLVELLWPEADETAGMSLRSAINALRAVLEPNRPAHAPSRYIPRGNNGYKFMLPDDGSVWIDALAFERQLDAALAVTDKLQAATLLAEALKLYSGDYLPEDEAESWTWGERERLRERYLHGMLALAEIQYQQQRFSDSLATSRKALAVNPLSEALYRLIMQAQAVLGDRAGALLTFERCRQMLDEQLGLDPSPQTLQLHTAILQGTFPAQVASPAPTVSAPTPKPTAKVTAGQPVTNSIAASVVGRKNELARLLQLFSQVKANNPHTVALIGEAGVGKSTLTKLFVEHLQTASARVLTTTCQAVEETVTFAPLTAMLGAWLRETQDDELARLPQPTLAQLAAFVPGLYARLPDLPQLPFINAEHAYSSLIAAIVEFFVALSQPEPLVLIWDDVQWADDSTLRVINRLANLPNLPLLILIIVRAEDWGQNALLTETVRTLQRGNRLVMLNLARFTAEEVSEYLRLHNLETRLDAAQLQPIVQGNPLFLSEAVRILEDGAELPDATKAATVIAQSQQIRDVLLARMGRLPAEAIALLETAAVIGRPFSPDLLKPALSPAEQEALNLLLARHFLIDVTADDAGEIELAFAHSLSSQIIYAETSALKRRQLHQQVAENMARYYGKQPGRRAAEIAEHYRKAGAGNRFKIMCYEVEAGDYARQIVSFRQAISHYDRAAQALEQLLTIEEASADLEQWQGRLYQGYAMAYEALLDWPGVQASYRKLWDWAEKHGDVRLAGSSALRIVFTRSLMGYLPEAVEIGQAFLTHFEAVVAREEGDAQKSLQLILTIVRHWMVLINPTGQPVSTPQEVDAKWPPLQKINLAVDSDEVIRLFGPLQAAFILTEYGRALLLYGQFEQAEVCLKAAIAVSEETNQLVSWVLAVMHYSRLCRNRGAESEAAALYSAILARVANIPEAVWVLTWPLLNEAYNLIYRRDLPAAQALLEKLEADLISNSHFVTHRYSLQIGWGILERARGNLAHARNLLKEALTLSPRLYLEAYILAELTLAEITAVQEQPAVALEQLRQLLKFCGDRGLYEFYRQVAQEIGRIGYGL